VGQEGTSRHEARRRGRHRRPAAIAVVSVRLLLVATGIGSAVAAGSSVGPACASGAPHAALVVATGDQTRRYCVTLDAASVSAIHVIELAGAQDGLDYRLGFGGQAVCELDRVGSSSADCFGAYPDFWGFWLGDGSGGWSWSGSGAASTPVHDGDVEGWSWGSGGTGATHPPPPPTTEASVCGASVPPPSPTATATRAPARSPSASSDRSSIPKASSSGPGGTADRGRESARATRPPRSPTASAASPRGIVAAAATTGGGGAGGPPAGATIAVAAVAILGLAGWLRIRGRSGSHAPEARREGR